VFGVSIFVKTATLTARMLRARTLLVFNYYKLIETLKTEIVNSIIDLRFSTQGIFYSQMYASKQFRYPGQDLIEMRSREGRKYIKRGVGNNAKQNGNDAKQNGNDAKQKR